MANEAKVKAERWIDILIDCALILGPLHRTQQCLRLRETAGG